MRRLPEAAYAVADGPVIQRAASPSLVTDVGDFIASLKVPLQAV